MAPGGGVLGDRSWNSSLQALKVAASVVLPIVSISDSEAKFVVKINYAEN